MRVHEVLGCICSTEWMPCLLSVACVQAAALFPTNHFAKDVTVLACLWHLAHLLPCTQCSHIPAHHTCLSHAGCQRQQWVIAVLTPRCCCVRKMSCSCCGFVLMRLKFRFLQSLKNGKLYMTFQEKIAWEVPFFSFKPALAVEWGNSQISVKMNDESTYQLSDISSEIIPYFIILGWKREQFRIYDVKTCLTAANRNIVFDFSRNRKCLSSSGIHFEHWSDYYLLTTISFLSFPLTESRKTFLGSTFIKCCIVS